MSDFPAHSTKGASSAERWMNCVGSVALIAALKLPDTDEPEYREAGTAAHAALAKCLNEGLDAWMVAGEIFNNLVCDPEMTAAVQIFLDDDRTVDPATTIIKAYTETWMAHPEVHPDLFGTIDRGLIIRTPISYKLRIRDFKYGAGIAVDAEWNPQLMYYAYLILLDHPEVTEVDMGIVQPRIAWHPDGIIRTWQIDAETVRKWAEGTLVPAMVRADQNNGGLLPGDWCRFCPAKVVCPVLTSLFGAAAKANPKEIIEWDDEAVARNYPLVEAVNHYIRALQGDAFRRAMNGTQFSTFKLVNKKADRVFTPEAETILGTALGDAIYTKPAMRSPAQIEKLGAVAKKLVAEYAYTPESGLTLALTDDNRPAVHIRTGSERFKGTAT